MYSVVPLMLINGKLIPDPLKSILAVFNAVGVGDKQLPCAAVRDIISRGGGHDIYTFPCQRFQRRTLLKDNGPVVA